MNKEVLKSLDASWQVQLQYGQDFLANTTNGSWQLHAQQLGYNLAEQVAIIPVQNVSANEVTISFPALAKKRKLWEKTVNTENALSNSKAIADRVQQNSNLHFAHINNKHSLSRQQRIVLTQALTLRPNEILYVTSGAGTGKTTIIQDFVASKWVQAIIENKLPPTIATIGKSKQIQKLTMLDCLPDGSTWLSKYQRQSFYQPVPTAIEIPKSKIVENFIQQCVREFSKDVTNLAEAKTLLRERVLLLETALKQGLDAACAYHELTRRIDMSYRSYGGIEQRNKAIKETTEKQDSYFHYLEVLQSLWHRQLTANSKWHTWLELLPPFKKRKTERLGAFIEKHLPDEDVKNLTLAQMEKHLQNLLSQAERKKHALADILGQIETDIKQLGFAKARAKRWIPEQIEEQFELSKLIKFIDTHLRYRIFLTAVHYWEAELLQTAELDPADVFNEYYAVKPLAISDLISQPVDWLVVENSEHLSPIDGFYCIEGSKHLIAIGDSNAISSSRIPIEIDINLLKQYNLIEVEEDIEDLQFKGILISNGQFSTLLEQIADYKGEIYCLNKQWDTAPRIIECQNLLSYGEKLQACKKTKANFIEDFSYLPVTGCREPYLGSFSNDVEVTAVLNWIKQHEASILACYPEYSFADAIMIYTTFYGQCLAFREALQQYNIKINNIELIQTLGSKRVPIVIFSPVYTKDDKGNLSFDQGEKILRNLLLSVKEHLLVFGDCAIFDQNLHSASGKFAKFLFESNKNKLFEYTQC